MEPSDKPRMSWRRSLLLIFIIGPVSFLMLFAFIWAEIFRGPEEPALFAFLYSYWGFAAGLVQRNLYRMLLGLNLGAVTGLGLAYFFKSLQNSAIMIDLVILALAYGFVLAFVCMDWRTDAANTAARGFVVGAMSVAAIAGSFLAVLFYIDDDYGRNYLATMLYLLICPSIGASVLVYFLTPAGSERDKL